MAAVTQIERIEEIIAQVSYKDWEFKIGPMGNSCYLQATFMADGAPQFGRKWYVSSHACRSEIVQTLLMAVLAAEEHEAREQFTYRGVALFGPHKDVESLLNVRHESRANQGDQQHGQ